MAKKPLESFSWSLEDLFKNVYTVPVYQRPYSWEEKQIQDLLEDLYDAYINKTSTKDGLFTGTIFLHSTDNKIEGTIEQYEIIDGQQRIASFSLILLYLYHLCHEYDVKENDETYSLLKNSLWKRVSRENRMEYRVLEMNSLEKQIFMDIFDTNFRKPVTLTSYMEKYKPTTSELNGAERRVKNNYKKIDEFFKKIFDNKPVSDVLDFIDFILL